MKRPDCYCCCCRCATWCSRAERDLASQFRAGEKENENAVERRSERSVASCCCCCRYCCVDARDRGCCKSDRPQSREPSSVRRCWKSHRLHEARGCGCHCDCGCVCVGCSWAKLSVFHAATCRGSSCCCYCCFSHDQCSHCWDCACVDCPGCRFARDSGCESPREEAAAAAAAAAADLRPRFHHQTAKREATARGAARARFHAAAEKAADGG